VEYCTNKGAKRGYVLEGSLTSSSSPTLPNVSTYSNFTSGTYGYSGMGQPLKYYEIGNGTNVAFIVFEQHGWEDAWAYDGIELVNMADTIMSNLSAINQSIFQNWKLYIIPYANPDGITSGYSCNGPGRCTLTTEIDMNRSWPSNFEPYYSSRYKTGSSPLGTVEGTDLKNFIENHIGNNQKIILDVHGWLNKTYGDTEIGIYFDEQFGFTNAVSYGNGYLTTWAKSIGAKTSLIELPQPSSASAIISNNYAGKLTNGIINMLNGQGGINEGGTEVNERVQVFSSGNVNVRSMPSTSGNIVASLANGTLATRIRVNVATANGYIWDKIQLDNGQVGYIATNFLITYAGQDSCVIDGYGFSKLNHTIMMEPTAKINAMDGEDAYATLDFQSLTTIERAAQIAIWEGGFALAAVAFSSTLEDAANNLLYFLTTGNSCVPGLTGNISSYTEEFYKYGHTRKEIYFGNAINSSNTARATFKKSIDYMMQAAENLIQYDATNINITCNEEVNGSCKWDESYDWFLAINQYRTKNTATVSKIGNQYSMQFNHNIEDYYDYTSFEGWYNLSPFLGMQTGFSSLHKYALARNYTNYALLSYTVNWTVGERFDTGANVIGPGI